MIQKIISIKKINLEDKRFKTLEKNNLTELKSSIKEFGLIHFPVITEREKGFIVVSGWKRISACLELGIEKIPVCILEEKNDLKAFLFRIYDHLTSRELNSIEKSEIISRLKKFGMEKEEIIQKFLPLFKIKPSSYNFHLYLSISELDSQVKKAVIEEKISFQAVKILTELSSEDQRFILPLILPLSSNYQKEFLVNIIEVSKLEDGSLRDIFLNSELAKIYQSEALSPLEKAHRIRELIRKKRYPLLSEWEDSFKNWLKEVRLPKGISISHSQFFEDERFSLNLRFRDEQELSKFLEKLKKICQKKEFQQFFEKLK